MSSAPASVALPALRRSRFFMLAGASFALLGLILIGGLVGGRLAPTSEPSPTALADIPADYLFAYQRAASRYGIDWAILAAIGKAECDHGRTQLPGCNPPGTVNVAGATGPMQFLGSTWRLGTPPLTVPVTGRPTATTAEGYAADGDGDGIADVWNPADAIAGAARLLRANGAPRNYERAIFAYNHADWYVREVLETADSYRATASALVSAPDPAASVREVLANKRIQLTGVQRVDLASGLIDARVVALLAWAGRSHSLIVTALRSDHSYYTSSENVSNHTLGRAADIGAVDGEICTGSRVGACGRLAVELGSLTGPLDPTELIYCFDPDGPFKPNGFALPDHCDHIHFGFDG
ncbi:MAG: lytic transglycosylase domain-containing protein [Nitriliruptorales bacterium]